MLITFLSSVSRFHGKMKVKTTLYMDIHSNSWTSG